jgi:hypothetical protein
MRIRLGGRSALLTGLVVIGLLVPITATVAQAEPSPSTRSHDFPDVGTIHPFHESISWMADEGFVTGYPDGTYRPELALSRQHMAQILWRMSGEPSTTAPEPFIDVGPSNPFYTAIRWGYATGVFNGGADNRFRPHATITRQALGAMLHRLSGIEDTYGTRTFVDVPSSHPFSAAISWWVNSGQAKGYTDGTFRPLDAITRQSGAELLSLFYEMMGGYWPYFDHSNHAEECDDPITPEQQAAADDLLADVLVEVAARWPTVDEALDAGYRITAPPFGGEGSHMVHPDYTQDDIQLDPTKPESLVLGDDNHTVAAAMFVREAVGEEGPQVGGCLTLWHAHDNLCYDAPFLEAGNVVWLAYLGGCPSGTMVRITPGMLHVWVDGRPDPFEGIET